MATGADGLAAVHDAERIIWVAGWRLAEQRALAGLAGTRGLACGRLEPRSEVIQLVTYDGEHLGHIRRESAAPAERWVMVPRERSEAAGHYASAFAAARALAAVCGKEITAGR